MSQRNANDPLPLLILFIIKKDGVSSVITIPVHSGRTVGVGLLKAQIKAAGVVLGHGNGSGDLGDLVLAIRHLQERAPKLTVEFPISLPD